ncbi:MAG TPA: hypothetical protein VGG14_00305 [Candidatus Sulfotelmatobacter sp.]|jgi:hypothetical protein
MAVLRLDIQGNPKTIPYRSFLSVANNSLGILDELDTAFSHRRLGAVQWFMNDLSINGKLRLEIYSRRIELKRKRLPDVAEQVTKSFVTGFRALEQQGKSPAYLSEFGMHKAENLTSVLGHDGATAVVASDVSTNEEVEITKQSAVNLRNLIPEAHRSYGSIEGKLEAISIHRGEHFVVYEAISGKGVMCRFPQLTLTPKAKDHLGDRVQVSGLLSRNAKGEPVRILIEKPERFKIFGTDLTILSLKSLGGSDPAFTGDLSTEDFIRSIRE